MVDDSGEWGEFYEGSRHILFSGFNITNVHDTLVVRMIGNDCRLISSKARPANKQTFNLKQKTTYENTWSILRCVIPVVCLNYRNG